MSSNLQDHSADIEKGQFLQIQGDDSLFKESHGDRTVIDLSESKKKLDIRGQIKQKFTELVEENKDLKKIKEYISGNTHSDDHDHSNCKSHSHGHSHGGQRDHKHHHKENSQYIAFFVWFMPTNVEIIVLFWFISSLKENPFEQYLTGVTMIINYILIFICQQKCITIKNTPAPRPPPALESAVNRSLDPVYKNCEWCKTCNQWKPMRCHHCSSCGKCTLKMDHHCPWILNCVGHRNHKAFYLFTVQMAFGCMLQAWQSWCYWDQLKETETFWDHSMFFFLYWLFVSVIVIPVGFMLLGLSIQHTFVIFNNVTTLENLAGTSNPIPCFKRWMRNPRQINIYDRGWIANLASFFNGDQFFFWWPSENTSDFDGHWFPINPPCSLEEISKAVRHLKDDKVQEIQDAVNEEIDPSKLIMDYEKYMAEMRAKYVDKTFQIKDRIFEHWKNVEQEQSQQAKELQQPT